MRAYPRGTQEDGWASNPAWEVGEAPWGGIPCDGLEGEGSHRKTGQRVAGLENSTCQGPEATAGSDTWARSLEQAG